MATGIGRGSMWQKARLLAVSGALFSVTGCLDGNVGTVKDGFLSIDRSLTLGDALDKRGSCIKTEWTSYKDDRGRSFVRYECQFRGIDGYVQSELEEAIHDEKMRIRGNGDSPYGVRDLQDELRRLEYKLESAEDYLASFDAHDPNYEFISLTKKKDVQRRQLLDVDVKQERKQLEQYKKALASLEDDSGDLSGLDSSSTKKHYLRALRFRERYDPDVDYYVKYQHEADKVDDELYSDFVNYFYDMAIVRDYGSSEKRFWSDLPGLLDRVVDDKREALRGEIKKKMTKINATLKKRADLQFDELAESEKKNQKSNIANIKDNIRKKREELAQLQSKIRNFKKKRKEAFSAAEEKYSTLYASIDGVVEYFEFLVIPDKDQFELVSGGMSVYVDGEKIRSRTYRDRGLRYQIERAYTFDGSLSEYPDGYAPSLSGAFSDR